MVRLSAGGADPLSSDRGVKYPQPDAQEAVAVLAAGIDWLTATARTPAFAELMAVAGQDIVIREAEAGNDLRPWVWKGYEGITAGGASVGMRSDGCLVRLSSGCAADHWRRCFNVAENVSRLDLAVTVRLNPQANPARAAYAAALNPPQNGRGRRVQRATHIETRTEGETAYLGSRQSTRFGRLYNKGLESGREEYRDAWRWEIEYKGATATAIAGEVAKHGSESEAVLAYVWDGFDKWGSPPMWGVAASVPATPPAHSGTDDDRRLQWLYAQVRPVIDRLRTHGRLSDAISALGLEERS